MTHDFHARRRVLGGLIAGAGLVTARTAAGATCALTPGQAEGPFYPRSFGESDADLTRVAGGSGRALGEVIEVTGRVTDAGCRPAAGAVIEIWQANIHGRYDHPGDRSADRPLDPNFQGYARLVADADGAYRFLTIVPGSYGAGGGWVRPPHIHFKVQAGFAAPVTTQMYFAGNPLNDADRLLGRVPPDRRAALVVAFTARRADGIPTGAFDLALATG